MNSRSYSYAQTLTPFLFFTRERPRGPNRAMKKKRRDDQRSNEHHELMTSAESNHESALSCIQIQPAPASPQPSLPPATVQLPPEQHQPAPPINRRLSFHPEPQQREESSDPGPQSQPEPSPTSLSAISDSPDGGDSIGDDQAEAEAEALPAEWVSGSPSPQPFEDYWEGRCDELETQNQRYRIEINRLNVELREVKADLDDAEAEVNELHDKCGSLAYDAAKAQLDSDHKVSCILHGLSLTQARLVRWL